MHLTSKTNSSDRKPSEKFQSSASPKIILPSCSPDLDGVACAVGYSELYRAIGTFAEPWYDGTPDAEAGYVLSRCRYVKFADETTVERALEYVLVDASDLLGLPKTINPLKVIEVVDHRLHHKANLVFPNAAVHIEPVGAAATLIAEKFWNYQVEPCFNSAILLYAAIHSNTQCLRGSVTTTRDGEMSDWLRSVVSIPEDLLEGQFNARKKAILNDISAAIQRESKTYTDESGDYTVSQLEFKGAGEILAHNLNLLIDYVLRVGPRTMLNLVDVASGRSYLLVPDAGLRAMISARIGANFVGVSARSDPAILRKQIVAGIQGVRRKQHDISNTN